MKKTFLLLLILVLLPVGSLFAVEPDDNGIMYEGRYKAKFHFFGSNKPTRTNAVGFVDLMDDQEIALLMLLGFSGGPMPDQELYMEGDTNFIEPGLKNHFMATGYFGAEGAAPPAEQFEEGQIVSIGEFKTSRRGDRIRLKGDGIIVMYESLVFFRFRFSGRVLER